jgi:hypothetical protein
VLASLVAVMLLAMSCAASASTLIALADHTSVTIVGAHAHDLTGYALASGDVNGDGHADLVIGSPHAGSSADAGEVSIVYGPFPDGATIDLADPQTEVTTIDSAGAGTQTGYALAVADFNGDGYDDVLLGAPFADGGNGAAFIVYGGPSLGAHVDPAALSSAAGVMFTAPGSESRVGLAVAAGDVNGDGAPDPVIAAPLYSAQSRPSSGAVFVAFAHPLDAHVDLASLGAGGLELDGATGANYPTPGADVGLAVAVSDLNGDGKADLIVSGAGPTPGLCCGHGEVSIVDGTSDGGLVDFASPGSRAAVIRGANEDDHLGFALAAPGDVDGDGKPDLVIGALNSPASNGRLFYVLVNLDQLPATSTLESNQPFNGYTISHGGGGGDGTPIATPGDLTGDHRAELYIGQNDAAPGGAQAAGAVFRIDGLLGHDNVTLPDAGDVVQFAGAQADDQTGKSVLAADLNGDHVPDLVTGAFAATRAGREEAGAVEIMFAPRRPAPPELVSVAMDGSAAGGVADPVSISGNGRFVAFASQASNLVPGDTNGAADVFVRDRKAGTTTRVSIANDGSQTMPAFFPLSSDSTQPRISADGTLVVFSSLADNLFDWNARRQAGSCTGNFWCPGELAPHVYVHSMVTGATTMVDTAPDGTPGDDGTGDAVLSANGRYVAFRSSATNLVADPPTVSHGPQVYVKDLQTGAVERVSVTTGGQVFDDFTATMSPRAISDDGNVVVFDSTVALDPSHPIASVLARDRAARTTTAVACCYSGVNSLPGGISGDGRFFAAGFTSPPSGYYDLSAFSPSGPTEPSADLVGRPLLNFDGSALFFFRDRDLVGDQLGPGIYGLDRTGGAITRMGTISNLFLTSMSRNGLHFAGVTNDDAVPADTNHQADAYVLDHPAPPPTISNVPSDITVTGAPAAGLAVTYATPTATDADDGAIPVTCVPSSGVTFPLGTTQVLCSAVDSAGIGASASFNVTVVSRTLRVIAQPTDRTVLDGQGASFSAAASALPTPTVQWQQKAPGGAWVDVPGATSTTYTFAASASLNGYRFRAVFTSGSGSVNTTAATLTVQAPPAIVTQPTARTVTAGHSVSFTAAASGLPTPTVQWQQSSDGVLFTDILGAVNKTYSFKPMAGQDGYRYRAVFTNVAGTTTTQSATLTVEVAPAIVTQPVAQTAPTGQTVTFSAAATGMPAPTVQWQQRPAGGSWADIPGATSDSYSFVASAALNHDRYRAIYANGAGSATTQAVALTVQG